jgi:hypothetical protein
MMTQDGMSLYRLELLWCTLRFSHLFAFVCWPWSSIKHVIAEFFPMEEWIWLIGIPSTV